MANPGEQLDQAPQVPLSWLEEIVSACPKDMQDEIREDYGEKINSLSEEEKKELLNAWKKEDIKNINIFVRLLNQAKLKWNNTLDITKASLDATKASLVLTKANIGDNEMNKQSEELKLVLEATKSALRATEAIEAKVWGTYKNEIQSKLASSISDPKTQEYFRGLGIDITSPEARSNPDTQKILLARASTQVYIERRGEISREYPDIGRSFDQLESLKFKLGIEATSRDVVSLMPDIPRTSRESIAQVVTTINKDTPENPITRKGDTLSFKDPKNESYTYQIDIGSVPPKLKKTLNGLSIARDITPLSPEDMEGVAKRDIAKKEFDKATRERDSIKNTFWSTRREEYSLTGTKQENQPDGTKRIVPTNLYSTFVGENRANNTQYELLEQKYANWEVPEWERGDIIMKMEEYSLKMKSDNASKSLDDSLTSVDRAKIDTLLEKRIFDLGQLRRAESALAKVDRKSLWFQPKSERSDDWESSASDALSFLSELGIQNLWQKWFEELIQAWNYRNTTAKTYQINLSESPSLDGIQRRSFTWFIKERFWSNEWDRNTELILLAKNLQNVDFINKNWWTPEKRVAYLFESKSRSI